MKTILFDLDGTLLPMKQDDFVRQYFGLIANYMKPYGFDSKALINGINTGLYKMVTNDGSMTNEDAFWQVFEELLLVRKQDHVARFEQFYATEFNKAIVATSPSKWARKVIDVCHEKGYDCILATNPIFPEVATNNRIRWAGLKREDFLDVTTYENWHYSKPNVDYYREIMDRHGLKAEDLLMVGNDYEEDLAAGKLGIKTYLVTVTIENPKNLPDTSTYRGSLEQLADFLKNY